MFSTIPVADNVRNHDPPRSHANPKNNRLHASFDALTVFPVHTMSRWASAPWRSVVVAVLAEVASSEHQLSELHGSQAVGQAHMWRKRSKEWMLYRGGGRLVWDGRTNPRAQPIASTQNVECNRSMRDAQLVGAHIFDRTVCSSWNFGSCQICAVQAWNDPPYLVRTFWWWVVPKRHLDRVDVVSHDSIAPHVIETPEVPGVPSTACRSHGGFAVGLRDVQVSLAMGVGAGVGSGVIGGIDPSGRKNRVGGRGHGLPGRTRNEWSMWALVWTHWSMDPRLWQRTVKAKRWRGNVRHKRVL